MGQRFYLAACALLLGLAVGAPRAGAEEALVVGSGPVAGLYYVTAGALCRVVNQAADEPRPGCLIESTAGSEANLNALRKGRLDLALVQSDWQYHAGNGASGPTESTEPELRSVALMHALSFTVLVRPDDAITALGDLLGRRLNMGLPDSAQRAVAETLLAALDWSPENFSGLGEFGGLAQVDALCAGEVDALVLAVSHPNGLVATATDRCGAKLIPVEGEAADRMITAWPFYSRSSIAGGLYRANPEPVPTFGLRAALVARADLTDDRIYGLASALFGGIEVLRGQHPVLANLAIKAMVPDGRSMELHPGALRYFQEQRLR